MNFIVMCIIPIFIATILIVGLKEKKDIFKLFVEGCLEGLKMVYKIFPFILAITVATYLLKSTGALDFILIPLRPLLTKFGIPDDIVPLCLMRPLSGGASMSVVMDILKRFSIWENGSYNYGCNRDHIVYNYYFVWCCWNKKIKRCINSRINSRCFGNYYSNNFSKYRCYLKILIYQIF